MSLPELATASAEDQEEKLVQENKLNKLFFASLVEREDIHLTATIVGGVYCVRVAIGSQFTRSKHVQLVWRVCQEVAQKVRADFELARVPQPLAN